MKDARGAFAALAGTAPLESAALQGLELGTGRVRAAVALPRALFWKLLSEQSGVEVGSEGDLLPLLTRMPVVSYQSTQYGWSSALSGHEHL